MKVVKDTNMGKGKIMERPNLEFIEVRIEEHTAFAALNRPKKLNAINEKLWFEIGELADWASACDQVRVLVLSGNGNNFTAGIDFSYVMEMKKDHFSRPEGKRQEHLRQYIGKMQDSFSAMRKCSKPTIAAVEGHCIGGGIDLITAFD